MHKAVMIDRILGEITHALQWVGSTVPETQIDVDELCIVDVCCKLYEKRESLSADNLRRNICPHFISSPRLMQIMALSLSPIKMMPKVDAFRFAF